MSREVSDTSCAELKKACHSLVVHHIPTAAVQHVAAARSMTFMPPATKRQAAMTAGNGSLISKAVAPGGGGATKRERKETKRQKTSAAALALVPAPVLVAEAAGNVLEDYVLEDDLEDAGAMEDEADADFDLLSEEEEEEDDDFEGAGAAGVKSAPKRQLKRQKLILDSDDEDDEACKPTPNTAHASTNANTNAHAPASAAARAAEDHNDHTSDNSHGVEAGNGFKQQPMMSHFGEAEDVPVQSAGGGVGEEDWPQRPMRGRENAREDDAEQEGARPPCDDGESIQRSAAGVLHAPTTTVFASWLTSSLQIDCIVFFCLRKSLTVEDAWVHVVAPAVLLSLSLYRYTATWCGVADHEYRETALAC